jgi:hypothetical protein
LLRIGLCDLAPKMRAHCAIPIGLRRIANWQSSKRRMTLSFGARIKTLYAFQPIGRATFTPLQRGSASGMEVLHAACFWPRKRLSPRPALSPDLARRNKTDGILTQSSSSSFSKTAGEMGANNLPHAMNDVAIAVCQCSRPKIRQNKSWNRADARLLCSKRIN